MKNIFYQLFLILSIFIVSSCASILSKSSYPLTVNTDPSGVNVIIKDGKGMEVFEGTSPATVKLKSGAGFFKKAEYTIHVSMEGFQTKTLPVNFKIDGWYWGNLLLGGVIGMLIVDPATGAMYKLEDEYVNISLKETASHSKEPNFKVYDIASIPKNWNNKLVRISP